MFRQVLEENNRVILLFSIITGLYWFSLYTYVPILSPYAESLGASQRLVGMILGSYGLIQMVARIPFGILSDSANSQKFFVVLGMFLTVLSGFGMWFFSDPLILLLFRALAGLAASTWIVFIVVFIGYFEDGQMPKAIGYLNLINAVGQIIGLLLGGSIAQYFGPQTSFLFGALGGTAGLILSFKVMTNKRRKAPADSGLKELLPIIKDKKLLRVSFLAALEYFIAFATVFGFTPVFAKSIRAGDFVLGLMATFYSLPVAFSAVISGSFFAPRFGIRRSATIGFILMAVSTLAIPYMKNVIGLLLAQLACGFGQGVVHPLLMSLSLEDIPISKRTTAMGVFQAILAGGMFAGPVLVGTLSALVGLYWGFIMVGLLAVLGSFVSVVIVRQESN